MTPPGGAEFGRRLRQAREARSVSLRQIAGSTKISIGVLEALERGDFSKLPGGIFGRAFVRSYAQEVGLDPEETVREFAEQGAVESPSGPPPVSVRPADDGESLFESQRRMAGVVFKLVLISLPIAALLLYLTLGRSRPEPSTPAPMTSGPAAIPAEAVVRSDTTLAPVISAPTPAALPAAWDRIDAPTQVPDPSVAVTSGNEPFLLEITATGPCWVSLSVDGTVVVSKVMTTDERVARQVRTGALIQVGDAGAFSFSLNGQPARPLGDAGQVRSVQITPANYSSFLR